MPLLLDVVAVAALLALLVTAVAHPPAKVEALVSVLAAAAALATGLVGLDAAGEALRELAPVVGFLAAILAVSDLCDRAGLFAAAGALLRGGGPRRAFTVAFALAAVVTAVLSLDATVVLLTPVVVMAARAAGASATPAAYACLRLANSASLLLPVSNLTNLLALSSLSLSFGGFALVTAPVTVAVLVVEYVGLSLLFRGRLRRSPAALTAAPAPQQPLRVPLPVVPTVVVALMLAGFALTSPLGVEPVWVAAVAALVLWLWGRRVGTQAPAPDAAPRRPAGLGDVVRAAQPGFALLVLSLGVVVAAVSEGFLGEAVAGLVPSAQGAATFAGLLAIAALATGLAAVLTNLSATLLLVPLVAPLGDTAVLAALVGLNAGAGLLLSGSLANLLWRRTMTGLGEPAPVGEFHRVSLPLTPVVVVVACGVLHLVG